MRSADVHDSWKVGSWEVRKVRLGWENGDNFSLYVRIASVTSNYLSPFIVLYRSSPECVAVSRYGTFGLLLDSQSGLCLHHSHPVSNYPLPIQHQTTTDSYFQQSLSFPSSLSFAPFVARRKDRHSLQTSLGPHPIHHARTNGPESQPGKSHLPVARLF